MGAEVVLVDPAPVPLHRVLGDEVGQVFRQLHADHGVALRLGHGVAALRGSKTVEEVVLDDGTAEPADVVVVGIGVTPRTEVLSDSVGFRSTTASSSTSTSRRTCAGVYAAGDVANAWHPHYRRHLRVEHWANALNQGVTAGATRPARSGLRPASVLLLRPVRPRHGVRGARGCQVDAVAIRGDVDVRRLIAFWHVDGMVAAAMHVNEWDVVDDLKAVVAAGRPVRSGSPGRSRSPAHQPHRLTAPPRGLAARRDRGGDMMAPRP